MYDLSYRTDPFAFFLEGLYHYIPLARSANTTVFSGLNKLYQIQSCGIPGNITHAIATHTPLLNNIPRRIKDREIHDSSNIVLLNTYNYATYAVQMNIIGWIKIMTQWIKLGANIERFKVKPEGFPEDKYWASSLGGMIKYKSYSPGEVVAAKIKDFVYSLKARELSNSDVVTALNNLYSSVNTQMQYLNRSYGKIFKPEPMCYGALLHLVMGIKEFLDKKELTRNKEYLMKLFTVVYQLCRMLFGYVGEINTSTLIVLNQDDEYTRISDTTVAALPAPNPNSIHYFREEEAPPISRHALYYVDRVCAAYKGFYKPI